MIELLVVTTTRADFGILARLTEKLFASQIINAHLLVTGTHLSPSHGLTIEEIKLSGFPIAFEIDILNHASDSSVGIAQVFGNAVAKVADRLSNFDFDYALILGDRYEALATAIALKFLQIPVIHLHGGEVTEGAYDDSFRHCITKLAHYHITTCKTYRNRIIRMGEDPDRVIVSGALGVENCLRLDLFLYNELVDLLKLDGRPFCLVTYQPVTNDATESTVELENLLTVINSHNQFQYIFTAANSDRCAGLINEKIQEFCQKEPLSRSFYKSLGSKLYLSAMKYCVMVIGNSSSGILEAPAFNVPSVDIGPRQKGRIAPNSVIHCEGSLSQITQAFSTAISSAFRSAIRSQTNPYYEVEVEPSELILRWIEKLPSHQDSGKQFYDA